MTVAEQLPQHMTALTRANEVRVARSRLLQALSQQNYSDSRSTVAALLLAPPACLASCTVYRLLTCIRKIGQLKARQLLRAHHIGETRTLGELTPRQRGALVADLLDGQVPA